MSKTKVKKLRHVIVASFAIAFFVAGVSFAADYSDWGTMKTDTESATPTTSVNINTSNMVTNGNPINLGAPPVPSGTTYNITGLTSGSTINAQGQGASSANASQIFVNNANTTTNINNVNLTNGVADAGGAIQNANNASGVLSQGGTVNIGTQAGSNRTQISGNYAGRGGAIYNLGEVNINNTEFSNNHAYQGSADQSDPTWSQGPNNGRGGVIFNGMDNIAAGTVTITDSTFIDNSSTGSGTSSAYSGVIHNRHGQVTINNSVIGASIDDVIHGNSATTSGGAIVNQDTTTINNSSLSYNTAGSFGGAILNGLNSKDPGFETDSILNLNNTYFSHNYASGGGAIVNAADNQPGYKNVVYINNGTTFDSNGYKYDEPTTITSEGGAIYNLGTSDDTSADAMLEINTNGVGTDNTVVFTNNIATEGGAIYNKGIANINNTSFINNGQNSAVTGTITTNGGAIYNSNTGLGSTGSTTVTNSSFVGNTAQYGGAIYNFTSNGSPADEQATVTIIDSNFSNNTAERAEQGGAIYAGANTITNIKAENKDVNIGIYGTSLNNGSDTIRLTGSNMTDGAVLNLEAANNNTLNINSTIYGNSSTNNTINANGGQVNINAPIRNSIISVNDGQLKFEHDRYLAGKQNTTDSENLNRLVMNGGTLNLLNNEFVDQLQAASFNLNKNSNIMLDVDLYNEQMDSIKASNFGGDSNITVNGDSILNISQMKSVSEAKGDSALIQFTDATNLIGHVTSEGSKVIQAPIYKYNVTQITQNSVGGSTPLGSGYDDGEYFRFERDGNSDNILPAPVAAQAAFLIMDNLYRQSFANMDMVTLMTPEQRLAWKMRNKYANAGYHTGVYAPNVIPEERDGFYVRPFTNFENVPLKNGPRVSNVSYGMLIGGESDLIDLGHGWDGNFSIFGAYHGSHQAYNGIGIWQNGGTLGAVGTAYKGNFWTGLTANIGASSAQSNTMFGNDDFPILMTGAAWKSGYNWGLMNNKFVIQPSYMMSYTFVNVFDYTNAAGVRVTQDPLHAIEIIPGLRLIANLKNGWQPYLACNMTWNIMDKTKFYANEVPLTPLSVKPYFEYGAGLQKRYGDRFTGFGQAMLRSGGRNGIAFTLGFRWALGH